MTARIGAPQCLAALGFGFEGRCCGRLDLSIYLLPSSHGRPRLLACLDGEGCRVSEALDSLCGEDMILLRSSNNMEVGWMVDGRYLHKPSDLQEFIPLDSTGPRRPAADSL